jgi:hypothetical protein
VQIRHGSALYPDVTIGTLTIHQYDKYEKFDRFYLKAQSMVAKIGGMIQGIVLLAKAICYFATKNMFHLDIMKFLNLEVENKSNIPSNILLPSVVDNSSVLNNLNILKRNLILNKNSTYIYKKKTLKRISSYEAEYI